MSWSLFFQSCLIDWSKFKVHARENKTIHIFATSCSSTSHYLKISHVHVNFVGVNGLGPK